MRRLFVAFSLAGAITVLGAATATASSYTVTQPARASGASPFVKPDCGGPGEGFSTSVNYQNAEVEPWVDVNPTNDQNIVGFWQQDRWSDGGSHGLVAGVSTDRGQTWSQSFPKFSRCAGGTGDNGGYERASDPWVSFGPTGTLHSISLSFDNSTARNAVLATRSLDEGQTWEDPRILKFDNPAKAPGNNFNDKESLTADPGDPNYVYAIWDRLVSPSQNSSAKAYENSVSFHGPTWFARSHDNGASWEPAHPIYDPKAQNQTISNQIVVLPDGKLVDGFTLLQGHKNNQGRRGQSVAVISSNDKGTSWSKSPTIVAHQAAIGATDPEPRPCRPNNPDPCTLQRVGDIIVDLAVDRNVTVDGSPNPNYGNVYMVWEDNKFSPLGDDTILFSRSTNGGSTWSAPLKVNQTPSDAYNPQAFTASVDVARNGDLAVTYYDQRKDKQGTADDDKLETDHWIVHSHDGGVTFLKEKEVRVTPASFDSRTAPYARGYFLGDYEGLAHAYTDNSFFPFYVGANDGIAANRTDAFFTSAK